MSSTRQHISSLAEFLDRVLDTDIVIDLWVRVSLVGIEILTIEARVVIASVNTFPHYAREISKIEVAEKEGNLDDLEDIEIEAFA